MLMVDVIFADVAQPDQARILGLNAEQFVKNRGHFMISIKASCVDSTKPPDAVFAQEIEALRSTNSDQLRESHWSHMKEITSLYQASTEQAQKTKKH